MPYEKQNWQPGDTVTASRLNHMEDGIAEGGSGSGPGCLIVEMTVSEGGGTKSQSSSSQTETLNKTAREIMAAFPFVFVNLSEDDDGYWLCQLGYNSSTNIYGYNYSSSSGVFAIPLYIDGETTMFFADSLDDYPVAEINPDPGEIQDPSDPGNMQ